MDLLGLRIVRRQHDSGSCHSLAQIYIGDSTYHITTCKIDVKVGWRSHEKNGNIPSLAEAMAEKYGAPV